MREISRREGVNREGNVSKRRKYLSPSNKSVKTAAEEFLEKASRELLGDNKSSVKGPFKLQDSDEDDDMSAEPIMSAYIKVSMISCIPADDFDAQITGVSSLALHCVHLSSEIPYKRVDCCLNVHPDWSLILGLISEPTKCSNVKVKDDKDKTCKDKIKILEARLGIAKGKPAGRMSVRSEPTEYSNSKVNDLKINMLETRIKILEARLKLERHPEDRACQTGAILYELLDDMKNLRMD
ncbi:hypothetical protein Tco_0103428 [Tanacetum coccineum]